MSLRKTLSIVCTVYYSSPSLPELFSELEQLELSLGERNVALDLIFVDDGSGDDSYARLLEFRERRPQTKVVKHARNFGAIEAARSGFPLVEGDCFLILASDLQDPPQQILAMVDEWLKGSKFVISVRKSREDPLATTMFAQLYYIALTRFVVPDFPKSGFDLMLLDRIMLPYMTQSVRHFNHNVFAYWLGFTPTVLEYDRRVRKYGRSRWTFRKKFNYFIDTIAGFSVAPLRMFSLFGIVVALLSFLYGAWMALGALLGLSDVPGFATVIVLLCFFSGMNMIMLGIIGEYIWRIFDATSNRPQAVIESIHTSENH
jgi:dolichol-phosphate mannosyltransferase